MFTLESMPRAARLIQALRLIHLYIGVFITPAILFFALTGALQTFGLHETNRDHPDYKPARWVAVLGQLHKKQTTILPVRRPAAVLRPAAEESPRPRDRQQPVALAASPAAHPLPLRIFFLLVSLGLFSSTLTGLSLTYKYVRNKPLITGLLAAGVLLPLALIFV